MLDLLFASAVGDLSGLRRCLRSRKGLSLADRTCGRGRNALQCAVSGGHATAAQELIEAGMPGIAVQDKLDVVGLAVFTSDVHSNSCVAVYWWIASEQTRKRLATL